MSLQDVDDARRSRVLLEKILAKRTEHLITTLVADYRSDKLVHDKLVGTIAEISGMKYQIDKLTREVSNG
jgi:hypothetical protein